MNALQWTMLGFGVTGLVLLFVLWLVFSYRRMQREQDAILQERDRLLRAAEQNIREAERLLRTSNQPTSTASPRMAAPPPVARPAAPRPAPTASRSAHSAPTRHRSYRRQQDDVDNSPVVASLLIHQHDTGYHYSDYSDSCGGGGDYGGGYDGGGGCDCGGGCD